MTASTPPLVDVIAEVLAGHRLSPVGNWCLSDGCAWSSQNHGQLHADIAAHQARAVLTAISEAGSVEWGVQLSESFTENHHGSRRGAEEAAKETGSHVITRVTLPWTAVEG